MDKLVGVAPEYGTVVPDTFNAPFVVVNPVTPKVPLSDIEVADNEVADSVPTYRPPVVVKLVPLILPATSTENKGLPVFAAFIRLIILPVGDVSVYRCSVKLFGALLALNAIALESCVDAVLATFAMPEKLALICVVFKPGPSVPPEFPLNVGE